MNAAKIRQTKLDVEKIMITIGMTFMEVVGVVLLVCTFFDIRILQTQNVDKTLWKSMENTIF